LHQFQPAAFPDAVRKHSPLELMDAGSCSSDSQQGAKGMELWNDDILPWKTAA
jgi:hypothetical protein